MKKSLIVTLLYHVLFWFCYIFYELSILIILATAPVNVEETLTWFILNITIFYACSELIFPKFWSKSKSLLLAVCILLVILTAILISLGITVYVLPLINHLKMPPVRTVLIKSFVVLRIWRTTWFICLGAAFWFGRNLITAEKKTAELLKKSYLQEIHEQELNTIIATTELAFIRSQINPHFLFNTLNFLYSSIYPLSQNIAKSVLILADIMRFVIENNESEGYVDLTQEIRHIENFILLNQLRFSNKLHINFGYNGIPDYKKVIPFIMMTLVENAFKYGDLDDPANPLNILIDIKGDSLYFMINNKINALSLYDHHGIGIENLKRRLQFFYADKFTLGIDNDGKFYTCQLEIEL